MFDVDADQRHVVLAVFGLHVLEHRDVLFARAAPRGPVVDHDDLAAQRATLTGFPWVSLPASRALVLRTPCAVWRRQPLSRAGVSGNSVVMHVYQSIAFSSWLANSSAIANWSMASAASLVVGEVRDKLLQIGQPFLLDLRVVRARAGVAVIRREEPELDVATSSGAACSVSSRL